MYQALMPLLAKMGIGGAAAGGAGGAGAAGAAGGSGGLAALFGGGDMMKGMGGPEDKFGGVEAMEKKKQEEDLARQSRMGQALAGMGSTQMPQVMMY